MDEQHVHMMTSSNGNIFRVTALCAGNSPVPMNSPHKGQWRGALMFSLTCVWINGWINNREAGDLRRYRAHSDVIVMRNVVFQGWITFFNSLWTMYAGKEMQFTFDVCVSLSWNYDYAMTWNHVSHYWPFEGKGWSPMDFLHKRSVIRNLYAFVDVSLNQFFNKWWRCQRGCHNIFMTCRDVFSSIV